jgi:hypothetical protein
MGSPAYNRAHVRTRNACFISSASELSSTDHRGGGGPILSEEQKRESDLKQQVINAGYRALAATLHPDIGGSREAMVRLNQLRDKLNRG